jgi:adenosylcobinamide amidohydrolase
MTTSTSTSTSTAWEQLLAQPSFQLRRAGRFVVAELLVPHHVLSTSVRNGGLVDHVRWLINHQSCEGTAHHERHNAIHEAGQEGYHDRVCDEVGVPRDRTATMGTAANMNYAAIVHDTDDEVTVTAVVTAGVEGNATAAGEPASWRETRTGMEKVPEPDAQAKPTPAHAGTINTMLFISRPMTAAALARTVVTMTEGKSAALQRLAVPSKRHIDLATGTGTDQYCIAVPQQNEAGGRPLTSASPHLKLGELIGRVTRDATLEALRWQNGLEVSYTRGLFHALGRFGVREATIVDDVAPFLSETDLELLKKNSKAAFYEPLVGAAAHALAAVCDRVRYGTLPDSVAADAMVQQAACLAANLAAQAHRWPEFRSTLRPHANGDVKTLVVRAIALGWAEKWRTSDHQ